MKAIILAGGEGLRLREVIKDLPKPMAPVAGKPFLTYLLIQLRKWAITDIVISVGYKKKSVQTYFKDGSGLGVRITYAEETERLGTAGAIKNSLRLFTDDVFLAMNGDSFFDADIGKLISFYHEKNARGVLALTKADEVGRYGSVAIKPGGAISSFREKGLTECGLINAGVYILSREVFNEVREGEVSLEEEILPALTGKGLFGLVSNGYFIDIGLPDNYLELCRDPSRLEKAITG